MNSSQSIFETETVVSSTLYDTSVTSITFVTSDSFIPSISYDHSVPSSTSKDIINQTKSPNNNNNNSREPLTEGGVAMIVIFSIIGGIGLCLLIFVLYKKRVKYC